MYSHTKFKYMSNSGTQYSNRHMYCVFAVNTVGYKARRSDVQDAPLIFPIANPVWEKRSKQIVHPHSKDTLTCLHMQSLLTVLLRAVLLKIFFSLFLSSLNLHLLSLLLLYISKKCKNIFNIDNKKKYVMQRGVSPSLHNEIPLMHYCINIQLVTDVSLQMLLYKVVRYSYQEPLP